MIGPFLLDTNVISATAPTRRVVADEAKQAARDWIVANAEQIFLPVTAIAEICAGIGAREAAGAIHHAAALAAWLQSLLQAWPRRILPFDQKASLHMRLLTRAARANGTEPNFADLTVGCIARAGGLVVATRNVPHFAPMGVVTLDPFCGKQV